jgi:hypothetical protein
MNITTKQLSVNFGTGVNKKLGVVIHTMVGTLDGTDAWFRNPDSQVSAHYGIDIDGKRIYRWLKEEQIAWAQGRKYLPTFKMVLDRPTENPNSYLISIECADDNNPAGADRSKQIPTLVELVKFICGVNNIPIDREHICGHREIYSAKTCPGNINVDEVVRLAGMPEMSDDEKRALAIIKTFKDNDIELVNGNYEGCANALVGAYRDLGGVKTALATLKSFRDGIAEQLNISGTTDTNKIATELSEAIKESDDTKNSASAGLLLFEKVTDWVNGQTWIFPSQVEDLLVKFKEKIDALKPPVYTPPDNVEGLTYVGKWSFFTHIYLHFKKAVI